MKLKYYLMGLGIGIFVTTLVLSFNNKKEKLSDEEIIARARELGMVMEEETRDSLKDIIGKSLDKTNANSENTADKSKDEKVNEESPSTENSSTETFDTESNSNNDNANEDLNSSQGENEKNQASDVSDADKDLADDENKPEDTDKDNNPAHTGNNDADISETDDYITFTVTEGMTSNQVAKLLSEIGLIDDAKDFDNYIIRMGKSTVIRIGTYKLHKNSSYEEILKAITKSSLHN